MLSNATPHCDPSTSHFYHFIISPNHLRPTKLHTNLFHLTFPPCFPFLFPQQDFCLVHILLFLKEHLLTTIKERASCILACFLRFVFFYIVRWTFSYTFFFSLFLFLYQGLSSGGLCRNICIFPLFFTGCDLPLFLHPPMFSRSVIFSQCDLKIIYNNQVFKNIQFYFVTLWY